MQYSKHEVDAESKRNSGYEGHQKNQQGRKCSRQEFQESQDRLSENGHQAEPDLRQYFRGCIQLNISGRPSSDFHIV